MGWMVRKLQATIDYCERFSKFNNKENIKEVRALVPSFPLSITLH